MSQDMQQARTAADPSFNPRTGGQHGAVAHTAPEEVQALLTAAATAAGPVAAVAPAERQRWLNAVADALEASADDLAALADEETGLGLPRLAGEVAGAAASARFYGRVAAEGSWLGAARDSTPAGTLVRFKVPLGPVAVFGASNFPFGFGVFGHDTASALAAGCPVVAKAHPAHPRLSVQIAELAAAALAEAGAPQGAFGLVTGFDAGLQAVDSPLIRAVAFTGSQAGGMALVQRAAGRGVPVFAEMGTVNPVLVTPAAAADGAAVRELAAGFTGSFTLGAGQFCTKPGLLLAPAGSGLPEAVRRAMADVVPAPLLTAGIAGSYRTGLAALTEAAGAPVPPADAGSAAGWQAAPELIEVRPEQLVPGSRLLEECFGPVALICEYEDFGQALALAAVLQPSLAASVFSGGDGDADAAAAVAALVPKVGRVAVNTWPTGVANTWAQQHGGPWPATSRPEATSVGAGALERFVRPVAVQNAPEAFLPPPVAPENPWGIPQRIDGARTDPGTT